MITVSLCMIVKNEAEVLARCLDSLADLMNEIIIVDTGSTDNTKEIAARYTDKIYDFAWNNDFASARNFSFSKATMDYIYAPDADEVLDEENRMRFHRMKQVLLPEVDIVQMKYVTPAEFNTVLNAKKEYRPKLFKRLRTFTWVDPVHETIQLQPVVFDSDIEILHLPQNLHSKRDFSIFQRAFERDGRLSEKIHQMYAKELFVSGTDEDFLSAKEIFLQTLFTSQKEDCIKAASCVLCHIYWLEHNVNEFFKLALKDMVTTPCAEICYELGTYFFDAGDIDEAILWFLNASSETESILDIHRSGDLPLQKLSECYRLMAADLAAQGDGESLFYEDCVAQADSYAAAAADWELPEEL